MLTRLLTQSPSASGLLLTSERREHVLMMLVSSGFDGREDDFG